MSGRWIILVVDLNQSQFILINLYATNSKTTNLALFQSTESKIYYLYSTYPLAKVIWGGDFNTVFDENMDQWPPKNTTTNCELVNICLRTNLIDIWRQKNPQNNMYIWSNKNVFTVTHRLLAYL